MPIFECYPNCLADCWSMFECANVCSNIGGRECEPRRLMVAKVSLFQVVEVPTNWYVYALLNPSPAKRVCKTIKEEKQIESVDLRSMICCMQILKF